MTWLTKTQVSRQQMKIQSQPMKFSEVRAVAARSIRGVPTSNDLIQAARKSLEAMCQEAAEYGLTTADMVKALLRPVFEERRSCDCLICKARRDELGDILKMLALPGLTDP